VSTIGSWPEVPPELLSPQLLLVYTRRLSRIADHGNVLPAAGIYLVAEGRVGYVNRGAGQVEAQAGDLVCLRPGFVRTCGRGRLRVYAAVYRPSASEEHRSGVPALPGFGSLPLHVPRIGARRREEAVRLYERMIAAMVSRRPTWQLETSVALADLIRLAFAAATEGRRSRRRPWSRWERLLALIETEGRSLSVPEMARELSMGLRTFSRGFRQRFGITPKQYLLRRKLWRARQELLEGRSVKEVAFATGFSSPSHFSRQYKRLFGVPPSEAPGREVADCSPEEVFPIGPLYFFAPGASFSDFRP
jgi:AraC-like DNA-binding protein